MISNESMNMCCTCAAPNPKVMSNSLQPHGLQHTKFPSPSQSLHKFISIESVMPSMFQWFIDAFKYLIPYCPLLFLPSIFPSIRVFSNELVLPIRQPKYQSFSLSISPSNEYSGLISFKIDWYDLPAFQETLKSLLHHHSLKASIIWPSASFMVQFSHLYMTTGKIIALTIQNFVAK